MCRVISQQELNRSIISIEISKEMMPIRMCGLYILDVPFSHPIVQEAVTKNAKKWMKVINGNKFCIGKNWIRWGMQDMPVCLRLWGFFYVYRRIDGSGMSRPYHSSKCLSFWCGPNNGLVRLIFGLRATSVETIVYEFWIPTSLISTSVNDAPLLFFLHV